MGAGGESSGLRDSWVRPHDGDDGPLLDVGAAVAAYAGI